MKINNKLLPPKECYGCEYLGQFKYYDGGLQIMIVENQEKPWTGCAHNEKPNPLCHRGFDNGLRQDELEREQHRMCEA